MLTTPSSALRYENITPTFGGLLRAFSAPSPSLNEAVIVTTRTGAMHDAGPMTLVIDRVEKCYGATRAVNGLSLTIGSGEFVGIIGPSRVR